MSMLQFADYASRPNVRETIDAAGQFEFVHAIVIDVDPAWLSLWRVAQVLPDDTWGRVDRHMITSWAILKELSVFPATGLPITFSDAAASPMTPQDFAWSCSTWEELAALMGEPLDPFLLKIRMAPGTSQGVVADLRGAIRRADVRVRFETMPVARFLVDRRGPVQPLCGGISIGAEMRVGTLGGFLHDGGKRCLAVTCGHLIDQDEQALQPAPRERRRSAPIGRCIASTMRTRQTSPALCTTGNAQNEVDAALIVVEDVASEPEIAGLGTPSRITRIDEVPADAPVQVSGRSGHRSLYTGGLAVVCAVFDGRDRYCYRNLFELRRSSATLWPITGYVAPPARPGDSGAWVVRDGLNGLEWAGMVVGGQGPVGLAVSAESVVNWAAGHGISGLAL